jgi:hypothetical protein
MNPASVLALAQFFVISPIDAPTWYEVVSGQKWVGIRARAVATIRLPHTDAFEVILQDADGHLGAFAPGSIRLVRAINFAPNQDLERENEVAGEAYAG